MITAQASCNETVQLPSVNSVQISAVCITFLALFRMHIYIPTV